MNETIVGLLFYQIRHASSRAVQGTIMGNETKQVTVGVDVGGTFTRVAAVNSAGRIVAHQRTRTAEHDTPGALIAWIARTIKKVLDETDFPGRPASPIGLALPGTIDHDRGILLHALNLPDFQGRPIRDELALATESQVALVTDAEAATWAEYACWLPPVDRFVHLRLGTGVACAVVIDGELVRFDTQRRTHLDVLVVDESSSAIVCRCGRRGCLETLASGHALEERARRMAFDSPAEAQRAGDRDSDAERLLMREVADAVARATANLVDRYQPDVVALGGGLLERLPGLVEDTAARWKSMRAPEKGTHSPCLIERARLGDQAGAIGAAMLAGRVAGQVH